MHWALTIGRAALAVALGLSAARVSAAQVPPQPDHSGQADPAALAAGQRTYATLCTVCHGPTGNGVANVDLRTGLLPRASTDAALRSVISNGIPQTGMPSFKLEPAELNALVAFIRAGLTAPSSDAGPVVGDASSGRLVFETKGNCLSCHRRFDEGKFIGPDLTEIGRLRQPASLERSLVDPTGSMQPINRPVRAVLGDGTVVTGRRLNEDLMTVQLITNDGKLVSLIKSELREWTVSTVSSMPSYKDILSARELADLVAYLMSLKGGRP